MVQQLRAVLSSFAWGGDAALRVRLSCDRCVVQTISGRCAYVDKVKKIPDVLRTVCCCRRFHCKS